MKTQTGSTIRQRVLLAGALALVSQAALSDEARTARTEAEELTVSARSQEIAIADPRIETDAEAVIEAMNRRVAEDLERIIDAISDARIELAISEPPTRG